MAPPLPPASRALEQHQEPRAELARAELAAEVQAELEEPPLRGAQPGLVLGPAQPLAQVELFQAGPHGADHTERVMGSGRVAPGGTS